jgi:hypothetical protein
MARRTKIGDIVEIPTAKGFAYAQFTHEHSRFGALIRILPSFFPVRPLKVDEIASSQEVFFTFVPLQTLVNSKVWQIVATCDIPKRIRDFPILRFGLPDRHGHVSSWKLWDGEKEWSVGTLTSEQKRLSIRSILNAALIVERIETGWRPENGD